ncbi:MAG: ribosome small subunit-dependent GTPase A [Lachnospiraceae bacterium]|nr:ribosome small subunit-dependent GTPase A [Lachnospiraceae bacterium]
MQGKIIKGIAGFYYVHVPGHGVYQCRARGLFRKDDLKPLVGDDVGIEIISDTDKEGNITQLLPRRSELIRPASANVDQAMIVFAVMNPKPNLGLLDRFLIIMNRQGIDTVIVFNKTDLVTEAEAAALADTYSGSGCRVILACVREGKGLEKIRGILSGRTTVVAGPSGVGKSSMTNKLYPEAKMQTGEISRKVKRGKQTTRHTELFALGGGTYIMDTPGFSSLYLTDMEPEELKAYYPEFEAFFRDCRFAGCNHINEPDCAVKDAVKAGKINRDRYEGYKLLYEELSSLRRY